MNGSPNIRASDYDETAPAFSPRQKFSLDRDWRFHLGDIPFPEIAGHSQSYTNAKAGRAWGAAAQAFDDTSWQRVHLPHDWAVAQPISPNANLSQGFRERGIGWYRRHFRLADEDRGRHLELQFDGVATHCTVWVNDTLVHRNWCGYSSFSIDLTPLARFGDSANTIVLRVDANAQEGWWYEGAGLYRHTWLVKRNQVHIATDGIYANPVHAANDNWTVPIEATLTNAGTQPETVTVESALIDPNGRVVCTASVRATVEPLKNQTAILSMAVRSPERWSVDSPKRYRVITRIFQDGVALDEVTVHCGFRTLRFDADNGFFLNDHPLKLQGVCNHQDHAGVGVAVPDSLWDFRIRRLKEMGVNAYRCAHNPPSNEFLECCDRLGLLVMDENRHFNTSPEYVRQLQWLVRRDRNRPCVILWSVFNEEPMQGTAAGFEMVRRMSAVVKELDSTRPVTAAMNGGLFTEVNVSQAVDVVGFNYQNDAYDRFHALNPNLPLMSAEDTSAFMTRGEFVTDLSTNRIDAYDSQFAPWGASHRAAWKAIATRKYLAGGFVWTGFDYRGEPTPVQWPSASSFFGCMDLCGFPKTAYYIHQAHWIKDRPVLHIAPHWNWHGRDGEVLSVMTITNADTVALLLNGKPLGERRNEPFDMLNWAVPYEPGTLTAVAYNDGKEVARCEVHTTGPAVALRLVPDRSTLRGDGHDAAPITVEAIDKHGRVVPTADNSIDFTVSGPAAIIGLGNGDPNCHEPEHGSSRSLFNGLAQVILQASLGGEGVVTLQASTMGLAAATLQMQVEPAEDVFLIPSVEPRLVVHDWRMSPVMNERPDPNMPVAENDMNTWMTVQPGELQTFSKGSWAVYRGTFVPFHSTSRKGGMVRFKGISGDAEVWLDGQFMGSVHSDESPFEFPLLPSDGSRSLNVLIGCEPGKKAGLTADVVVE